MFHAQQGPEDVSVKGCRIALCGLLRYETTASLSRGVVDSHIQAQGHGVAQGSSPPAARISSATFAAVLPPSESLPISLTTTLAPCWAVRSASQRPIPLPLPVTIVTLPARRLLLDSAMVVSPCLVHRGSLGPT